MRFLPISIVLLLFISCGSYPKKNGYIDTVSTSRTITNPYFSNPDKDYVYKAKINAFGNSFGGILIVKKLGMHHHRIAFTTELGNKIFDFLFQEEGFKVNYILKRLDKKIFINILRNDFRVLIQENLKIDKAFSFHAKSLYQTNVAGKKHFILIEEKQLHKIIKTKNARPQVEFLFSEINDDLANAIEINHQNLRLSIRLKSI